MATPFFLYGAAAAQHPRAVATVVLLLCAFSVRIIAGPFPEGNSEDEWIPDDSAAEQSAARFAELWGAEPRGEVALLSSHSGVRARDSLQVIQAAVDLDVAVRAACVDSDRCYAQLCASATGATNADKDGCRTLSVALAWDSDPAVLAADSDWAVTLEEWLAVSAAREALFSPNGESLQALYAVDDTDVAFRWELQAKSAFEAPYAGVCVSWATERSFQDELDKSVVKDIPLFALGVLFMCVYVMLTMGRTFHRIRAKPTLALAAVFSVFLAITSGFGAVMLAGVPFVSIVSFVPFVVLGIGVDDAFLLSSAFDATLGDEELSMADRVGHTLRVAGPSVTMTTMTTGIAFALGLTSSLPALRSFAAYAATVIVFDYLFQLSFFLLFLIRDGRRVLRARPTLCCTWRRSSDDNEKTGGSLRRFISNVYLPIVARRPVRIAVLVSWVCGLLLCGWAATTLEQGLVFADLFTEDSPMREYFNERMEHWGAYQDVPVFVVVQGVDYDDSPTTSVFLDGLVDLMHAHDTLQPETVHAWYEVLQELRWDNETLYDALDRVWYDDVFVQYQQVVLRDATSGSIYASAFTGDHKLYSEQREVVAAMESFVRDVEAAGAWVYSPAYRNLETDRATFPELRLSIGLALGSVVLVVGYFVGSARFSLLVTVFVIAVDVSVLGAMAAWGVRMDAVALTCLVMSIGLSVDYVAHVAHAYAHSTAERSSMRIAAAMAEVAPSIISGGLSTLVACSPLLVASNAINVSFGKITVSIIVLAMVHGLVILPAFLSTAVAQRLPHRAAGSAAQKSLELPGSAVQQS